DADVAHAVKLQSDGKIVVAGVASSPSGGPASQFAVARYNSTGALDASFGTGGRVTVSFAGKGDEARALAIQSDGKMVVAGFATTADGSSSDFALVRLNLSGSPDTGFGAGGKVTTDFAGGADRGYAIAIQLDNKIIVAGSTATGDAMAFALARYNPDGALDTGFGSGGVTGASVSRPHPPAAPAHPTDNKIIAPRTPHAP